MAKKRPNPKSRKKPRAQATPAAKRRAPAPKPRTRTRARSKPIKGAGAKVRRAAKVVKRATRGKFAGGLTKQVAKGYKAVKEFFSAPVTIGDKESRLARIGIKPYKPTKRKRTPAQKKKINALYTEFAEFASRGAFKYKQKFRIIRTANAVTLNKARKSGMAVYEHSIYVHVANSKETVKLGTFMGEKIMARTYYGKLERIFLGGADVFTRVVNKLQKKKLAPGQMITGAFFGGPTFHRAIYSNVGEFLNYINNTFVPHLAKGVKPTKRTIARAKSALMKNIAIVQIENPEFEDDSEE